MPNLLNEACYCVSLDESALRSQFDAALLRAGSLPELRVGREHLFAPYPVFANSAQLEAMRRVIRSAHEVMALPAFREVALEHSAWPEQYTLSAMMAFDFHPEAQGAKLIEINTNAGGAYLAALLAESQRACCVPVAQMLHSPGRGEDLPQRWLADFRNEWHLARGEAKLSRILIVDDQPEQQFLYPEFLLFRELFRRNGIECDIADARELQFDGTRLLHQGNAVNLVYNRCTDFALNDPAHHSLREACIQDAAVLTPSPRHHALYADKHNLVRLSDQAFLQRIGASSEARSVLAAHVPAAHMVSAANAEQIWAGRKKYFFKPAAGYASRGAYRGDRITRRVWGEILAAGNYIAQQYTPPAIRRGTPDGNAAALKFDLRCVSYGSEIRLLSARLYQGQTTNMRTESGGLATVFLMKGTEGLKNDQFAEGSKLSPTQTTA